MVRFNEKYINAELCPYCHSETPPRLTDSAFLYNGTSYGMVFFCDNCGAFVGCHKKDNTPKGRLANQELRALKKEAHKYFDNLWMRYYDRDKRRELRKTAYAWLAQQLDIDPEHCHIGYMDDSMTKEVIRICKPLFDPKYSKYQL